MGRTKTIDDEEILRKAREVFREGGHAASTRDVARAARISQAVLFQRFGSKENLFLLAMTPESPDVAALLGPYPPRGARADLKQIGGRLAEYLATLVPTLLHVLAHPDIGHHRLATWHSRLPFEPLLAGLTERFARMREDGLVGRVDPGACARAFLAGIHSTAVAEAVTHHGGPAHRRDQIESLVEVLWTGFAPSRSAGTK